MKTTQKNPLQIAENEQFMVGTSDFSYFENPEGRCENGAVVLIRKGHAELTLDNYQGTIRHHSTMMILPGSALSIRNRSKDFSAEFFAFTPTLFSEAAFRLELDFIRLIKQHPVHELSSEALSNINIWLKIIDYTYRDRENRFRNTIIRNRLQNALLESCNKAMRIPKLQLQQNNNSRQSELFVRFIQLVNQHCSTQREVAFYAREMCISTRYLASIIHSVSGRTAKELIDSAAINELKLLLKTSDLSIQEIAYRMRFPDQSYLGRFFRKHVGISPSVFRMER